MDFLWIATVAITWGGYPLIARSAGAEGPRATLILMLAGLLPIVVAMFRHAEGSQPWPTDVALVKLLIAGVLMGVGLLAFHVLMKSTMDASVSVPIVNVSMLLVSVIGAVLCFGEVMSLQKLGGITLLIAGIALLRDA